MYVFEKELWGVEKTNLAKGKVVYGLSMSTDPPVAQYTHFSVTIAFPIKTATSFGPSKARVLSISAETSLGASSRTSPSSVNW